MTFHQHETDRAVTYLKKLHERGKSVKIEPITFTKTLSQNSYCWLVFTHIARETGNFKEDVYQLCLKKFPVFRMIDINGVIDSVPLTLSGMNKDQTSRFIDDFTTWFRSEGFDIPDPEDFRAVEMYQWYKEKGQI